MRPPPLALLQALNACQALASFLAVMTATAAWNRAGWSEAGVGLAMTATNLAYALLVGIGGRLSDRWGRARTAASGAALTTLGALAGASGGGPESALAAAITAFAGCALFFPANAGLISDATPAVGAAAPLHAKLARYTLGWGAGNLGGFLGYTLLADAPTTVGFLIAGAMGAGMAMVLLRWRRLPPQPPPPAGDRAPHPALPRLTLAARLGLLAGTASTFAFVALLQSALQGAGLAPADAQRRGGLALLAYSTAYLAMFALLGAWSGWILRPWRMWALQTGLVLGAGGVLALGLLDAPHAAALALCGAACGLSFGATLANSLYYSLRLPDGAGRAAALHETCLGVGNTLGPLIGGLVAAAWIARLPGGGLAGLGAFMLAAALVALGVQAALAPRVARG